MLQLKILTIMQILVHESQDKHVSKLMNSEAEYSQEEKKPEHKRIKNEKSLGEERPGRPLGQGEVRAEVSGT